MKNDKTRALAAMATMAAGDSDSATRELTSDLVRSIRAFATNANNTSACAGAAVAAVDGDVWE